MDTDRSEQCRYINNNFKWLNSNNKYEILYKLLNSNKSAIEFRTDNVIINLDLLSEKELIDVYKIVYDRYDFLDSRY